MVSRLASLAVLATLAACSADSHEGPTDASGEEVMDASDTDAFDASLADAIVVDGVMDLGPVDFGPPTPTCSLPVYDTAAFAARCASGSEMPVPLDTAPGEVAFDETLFGVLAGRGDAAELRVYGLEGESSGHVGVPNATTLVAFDCGLAMVGLSTPDFRPVLRIFDHDLVEHGARGALEPGGPLLVWDGARFASFLGYPAGASFPNHLTFLDRDGEVVTSEAGEWAYGAQVAAWDGSQYIVGAISGPPNEMLTGLDRDGHRIWSTFGDRANFATLVPSPDGFLEQTGTHVTARSHVGAALGPGVDLSSTLPLLDPARAPALGSGGGALLAAFTGAAPDGTPALEVVALDTTATPVGTPRTVPGADPTASGALTLLWAGYSFAVFFEPASAPGTLSMVRICP